MSNRKEKREQRKGQRKEQAAKERELQEAVVIVEENMRKASQEAEQKRQVVIKAAEEKEKRKQEPVRKSEPVIEQLARRVVKTPKLITRTAKDPDRRILVPDHEAPPNKFTSLWDLVKMNPSTRTSTKGQPSDRDYTLITRHVYPEKFVVGIKIPVNAQVKHVRGYPESPEHWEVMLGDAFLYSDISLQPIHGEWMNGQIEVKVKRVFKPNERVKEAVYVYANMYPVDGQVPDHEAVFSSDDDTRAQGSHFGPSSGRFGTFLHLYPLDAE